MCFVLWTIRFVFVNRKIAPRQRLCKQYGSVRALDTLTRSDGNDERPIVSLRDTLFSSGRAFHLITNVWRSDAA
jgi:hypothetical protein